MNRKLAEAQIGNEVSMDLMLENLKKMRAHFKETGDAKGEEIFNDFTGYTGIFINSLFELHEKIMALKEELETEKEASKEDLKRDLRADFEELVTHLIDDEDQEGFETLVRIKKGTNALIEGLIRREEDVFERWEID